METVNENAVNANNGIRLTAEQLTAVTLTGRDLLVSAGAGAGKSSVMAQRIVRRITDPNDACPLDRMLVVTFTVAAAAEIRKKIFDELKTAAARDPSPALKKAIDSIASASIDTINGFCFKAVKREHAALGLPASMRIADDDESDMLCRTVLSQTIDDFYADGGRYGCEDFDSFVANLIEDKDVRLEDYFLELYKKLVSLPRGTQMLYDCAQELAGIDPSNFFASDWGKTILDYERLILTHYERVFTEALDYFNSDDAYKNYREGFSESLNLVRELLDEANLDYDFHYEKLVYKATPLKKIGADYKTDDCVFFAAERNNFKADLEYLKNGFFFLPSSEIGKLASLTSGAVRDLGAFLCEFDRRFAAKKIERRIMTFADCERYLYRLLRDPETGEPTPTAMKYRRRYREIYIDEYQDTNELQDRIFSAMARPGGRFMVGDIKQSIYAFRGADSSLFSWYRNNWQQYSEGDGNTESSLYLSTNFRSTRAVLSTVNCIFGSLFSFVDSLDYREEDALRPRDDAEEDPPPVVFALVSKKSSEEEAPDAAAINRESRYTAREIRRLIDSGVSPADVAVLYRSRNVLPNLTAALDYYGVPYGPARKNAFFNYPEILYVMSVLRAVDNSTRDVDVAAVITGPLYGYSFDDLAVLRYRAGSSLYESVRASGDERLRRFVSDLAEWRAMARSMPSHEFIRYLYVECGLIAACCSGRGEERRRMVKQNCDRLYEMARSYESGGFKGLYSFIDYVDMIAGSYTREEPRSVAGDAIVLSTIHGAKGLEYEYCFIIGCGKKPTENDNDKIAFSKELGFSMDVRDPEEPVRYKTPFSAAVRLEKVLKDREDGLRALYVAMTRARKRLWLVGEPSKYYDTAGDKLRGEFLSGSYVLSKRSFFELTLPPVLYRGDRSCYEIVEESGAIDPVAVDAAHDAAPEVDPALIDEVRRRFAYEYPYKRAAKIPAKLSVSRLYPGVLDDEGSTSKLRSGKTELIAPSFGARTQRRGGAFVGTSTHVFMQFCDFAALKANGVKSELDRLTAESFLSRDVADAVSVDAVEGFVRSDLFAEITASPEVWRERRFNVLLPAAEFSQENDGSLEGEQVLVQGVVDCVYVDRDGKMVLVDYKTDSTRGLDREEAIIMLKERHSQQLKYYKRALEKLTGGEVSHTVLYSFGLGEAVELEV